MGFPNLLLFLYIFQVALVFSLAKPPSVISTGSSNLFREYIGAEFNNIKFSDVPINPDVEFHFILSFALDYTTSSSPSPTNGKFNALWDTDNLSPSQVSAIKTKHKNVKVALSLGGDTTVSNSYAYFQATSVKSWLSNAVPSLTKIIQDYHLDGIDIDYEHFKTDPATFAECVGQLISTLKKNGVISFASIAPYEHDSIQAHYKVLWKRYGNVIDYVNFQFYAYDEGISVKQFLEYFDTQSKNYDGGKVLVSFSTDTGDGGGGLAPGGGFFTACRKLKTRGNLHGIFVWSADDSKGLGFKYEKMSQSLLAS